MDDHLFTPLQLRSLTLRNRIAVSPMCQYSCQDGIATHWHLVHLGSRATGGAAMVISEATAVDPRGRISPNDLGLWNDSQADALRPITAFVREQGAVPAVQLSHAGRKASTRRPWEGGGGPLAPAAGGWVPVAPSAVAFGAEHTVPEPLDEASLAALRGSFVAAAKRALEAGFQVIEIHAAHGYLLHEFLSPLANRREDVYGGSFENRARLLLETTTAVRAVWPDDLPLLVRISATDWVDDGWSVAESIRLAAALSVLGVDLVDCSSGGVAPGIAIPIGPGYQVPLAAAIRSGAGVMTGAVGMITEPVQADTVVREGSADLVLLARQLLREPSWPLRAAHELGADELAPWPKQYDRARP